MKRPDEVTEYLRCGGMNCDNTCSTQLDRLGVEDCLTWRVHGYVQQLEERVIHLEALNQQNLSVITMQERTRARLEEQISQLETQSTRWISVEERLPISDEYVLCWYTAENGKKWHTVGKLQDQNGTWELDVYLDDPDSDFTVTHWMPIPQPPKEV